MPKLTARQKVIAQAKEKELRFLRQQNSVQLLSQPTEKQLVAGYENELYQEIVGDKKANDGLHLSSEHIVITRDQPDPVKLAAFDLAKKGKEIQKEEQKDPQAWEVLTEGEVASPESKLESPISKSKKDLSRKSPPPKTAIKTGDQFAIKEFTATKTSRLDSKGQQIGGVWQDHQQIDITNYQQSQILVNENQKKEAFIKRMQNSMISKDRKTKKNQDLEIQTQLNLGSKIEKQSVGFTDQQSSVSVKNKTLTTLNAKQATGGILKSSNVANMNNTQVQASGNFNTITHPPSEMVKTERNQTPPENKKPALVERQQRSREDDFMDIGNDQRNSFKQRGKNSKYGSQDKWWEEENRGLQNSQWAGLTQMPGSGVALGGKGFKPGDLSIPNKEIDDVINQKNMVMGLIPPRKKGKLCWANVNPSIEETRKATVEATMQEMVYSYTRRIKQHDEKYEKIFEERMQKMDEQEFFSNGLTNAQDKKLQRMKKKLNQSVDFAEIKEREIQRFKKKYDEYPIYQEVTEKMTFKNEEYMKFMQSSTDPKYSPLTPAQYITPKEDLSGIKENQETKEVDIYDPDIPALDNFSGGISYEPLLKDDRFSLIQDPKTKEDSLYKKQKALKKRQDSVPVTPKTMRDGTEQVIPEVSNESGAKQDREYKSQPGRTIQDSSQSEEENQEYDDDIFENPLDEQEPLSGSKTTSKKPQSDKFVYSIRNRSKKEQKAKQSQMEKFASDIDKPKGPQESWQDNKLQMLETEKVFKIIHEYCQDHLNVGYNMIDKTIEDLLRPNVDVSPLLKFYNHLASNSSFRLPQKSLLEFDQKFYRAFINRLREAQKVEVKWVKNTIINESRKTCMTAFDQARNLMQAELKDILYGFDALKAQLDAQVLENLKLKKVIESQQLEISEQQTFVKQTVSKIFEDDEDLYYLNAGPGGAYDSMIYGDVIQGIDQYHRNLQDEMIGKTGYIEGAGASLDTSNQNIQIQRSGTYRPQPKLSSPNIVNSYSLISGTNSGGNSPNPRSQSKSMAQSPLITTKILQSSLKEIIEIAIQNQTQWKNVLPSKENLLHELEPFLKNPMSLFGGYVKLSMKDSERLMQQELYKFQKNQIKKQVEKNDTLEANIFGQQVMMEELRKRNDMLQIENDKFHDKLNEMRLHFEAESNQTKYDSDQKMNEVRQRCMRQMKQARQLMSHEVEICTQIKDKMLNENVQMGAKLRKFATIIKIPRLHFEYIEKYGVNEFVTYCEDIVKRERSLIDLKKAQEKQVQLRNEISIQAIKKVQGPIDERIKSKKFDMIQTQPFKLSISATKDLQNAGRLTAKDKENEAILKHLIEVNWIKNKSVLDMRELLEKNMDRQPELLAMMQPDLKSHMLNNPALLKSIEELQKSDPINKRTKNIRNFISQVKSETFGGFNNDNIQHANNKQLIELKRNINKSMDLKEQFNTIDIQDRIQHSKKLHLRSSSYVGSDSNNYNDGMIIVQVNSNNDESSKRLLQSISGSNQNNTTATRQQSSMFGINRTELNTSNFNMNSMRQEDMKELKDTVSGLPSLMTRVSTTINEIQKSPETQNGDYAIMDSQQTYRNAVSSRIVGLNQLNKNLKSQKKYRYNTKQINSPSPNEMLNEQSDTSLNPSIALTNKKKKEKQTSAGILINESVEFNKGEINMVSFQETTNSLEK